jgi:hypothetical protein
MHVNAVIDQGCKWSRRIRSTHTEEAMAWKSAPIRSSVAMIALSPAATPQSLEMSRCPFTHNWKGHCLSLYLLITYWTCPVRVHYILCHSIGIPYFHPLFVPASWGVTSVYSKLPRSTCKFKIQREHTICCSCMTMEYLSTKVRPRPTLTSYHHSFPTTVLQAPYMSCK